MSQSQQPEHPPINTMGWIKTRLQSQSVYEEGGKWKVRFQGKEVGGEFAKQSEALKAYRKAAEDKWHEGAILPTDAQIDAAGEVPVPPKPGPRPQQAQSPRPTQPQPTRPQPRR